MDTVDNPKGTLARRGVLVSGSVLALSCLAGVRPASAAPESDRPKRGDHLVGADSSPHEGKPITLGMLTAGGDMIPAWPADPSGVVRSQSRFNKVLLIRVDPATLDEKTRAIAVDGVLAYSGWCTHQGCAVAAWIPEGGLLACPCHGSSFDVTKGGIVAGGPAQRRLAALPLVAGENGTILVADGFTSKLGHT